MNQGTQAAAPMKSDVITVGELLADNTQYKVPIYQRVYSWKAEQWRQLWSDLVELSEDDENRKVHFLGPLICSDYYLTPGGLNRYLLVDGQQRIATLLFLLTALRESIKRKPEARQCAEELNQHLLNSKQTALDTYKLVPLEKDMTLFKEVIHGQMEVGKGKKPNIYKAYLFFKQIIKEHEGKLDFELLILNLLGRMTLIRIALGDFDNAHEVFSSINAKGENLKEHQLIKNYLFMHIEPHLQERADDMLWEPISQRLGDTYLTRFFNCFVNKNGKVYKVKDTYTAIRDDYNAFSKDITKDQGVRDYLETIDRFSKYYASFLKTETEYEQRPAVRTALEFFQPKILNVSDPYYLNPHTFLLNLFEAEYQKEITEVELIRSMGILQNLIVRAILFGNDLKSMNSFFSMLHGEVMNLKPQVQRYDSYLKNHLGTGQRKLVGYNYKNDKAFEQHRFLVNLNDPTDKGKDFTLYLLKQMEQCAKGRVLSKENIYKAVRIMPTELSNEWSNENNLKNSDHRQFVNYIGNFALYYAHAQDENTLFQQKKKQIPKDIYINNGIFEFQTWNTDSILKRSKELFISHIAKLWPDLSDTASQ